MNVAALYRHPIKAVGFEPLDAVALAEGAPMPGDRIWAIAHSLAKPLDPGTWAPSAAFFNGKRAQALMAVTARMEGGRIALSHPALGAFEGAPDLAEDAARLLAWLAPLAPEGRAGPGTVLRAPEAGMADRQEAPISLLNRDTLAELSRAAGQPLHPARFRGNIWIEGAAPWAEQAWAGRRLSVGGAVLEIVEPLERCRATDGNPETGEADTNLLSLMDATFGHRDFGLGARVVAGGAVALGDAVTLV